METQAIGSEIKNAQEKFIAATTPFQEVWRQTWIEWPVTVASESLRFAAQRFRAQSDYFARLQSCASVPEFIEAHSHFMRGALDDYGLEASKVLKDAARNANAA